jgi:hypothetical protein
MSAKLSSKSNVSGNGFHQGFGQKCNNLSLSEIYRQKIKGNRFAFWHCGIRGITGLQACSPKYGKSYEAEKKELLD